MSTDDTIPQKPSFGRRLLSALKHLFLFLFRVILTLLVLGAIGAAIYLGAPVLIDEYILKDVKINTRHIQEISTELETNADISDGRLADLQTRLDNLEIQGDTDKQILADTQVQLEKAEARLQEQAESLQGFDELRSSLDEYAGTLELLEERLAEYEADLEKVQDELATINPNMVETQDELKHLIAQFEAREPAIILRQDLALLKVMELITRVRVSMGNENLGLAKDDLGAAQDLLASLSLDLPANQVEYLNTIAGRLSLASDNLTQAPSLVDQDLEAAWQLLFQGLPEEVEAVEATPTPTPTPKP